MTRILPTSIKMARAVEKESKPSFRRILVSILSVLLDIEQQLYDDSQTHKPKKWVRPNNAVHIDPQTQYLEKW